MTLLIDATARLSRGRHDRSDRITCARLSQPSAAIRCRSRILTQRAAAEARFIDRRRPRLLLVRSAGVTRVYHNISNTRIADGFLSSSPTTPASQSGLCGRCPSSSYAILYPFTSMDLIPSGSVHIGAASSGKTARRLKTDVEKLDDRVSLCASQVVATARTDAVL